MGQTIDEVVDQQITRTKNVVSGHDHGRRSSLSGAYQPSFGSVGRKQQQQQGGVTRDLEDVNEALEARVKIKGSVGGQGRVTGLGGGRSLATTGLGSRPSGQKTGSGQNSLIEIGSSSSMMTGLPKAANNNASSASRAKPKGIGMEDSHQRGKRSSLGLSYGPIISSLDDQARRRAANISMQNGNRRDGGGLGQSGIGLGSSARGLLGPPIRGSGLQASNGSGSLALGNSIQRSWQQQVDAATARAVARNGRSGHHLETRPRQDGYYRFPPDGGTRANEPQTLTLDNWFSGAATASSIRPKQEQEEGPRTDAGGSGRSSRRTSA